MEGFGDHTETMRFEGSEFSCNICHKSLCNLQSLRRHLEIHNSVRQKYICNICNADFTTEKSLTRHLMNKSCFKYLHLEGDSSICSVCKSSFTDPKHFRPHIQTGCEGDEGFPCSLCKKTFPQLSSLQKHKQVIHHLKKKPDCKPACPKSICTICKTSFIKREDFREHLKTVRCGGKERYPCNICDKCFPTQRNVRRHQETHDSVRQIYTCDSCDAEFIWKGSLVRHLLKMKNCKEKCSKSICSICRSSFSKWETLRWHNKTPGCDGNDSFSCDICNKSFSPQNGHNGHQEIHSDSQQKRICDTCNAEFTQKSYLNNHHEAKQNRKPNPLNSVEKYTCSLCNSSFDWLTFLDHMEMVRCGNACVKAQAESKLPLSDMSATSSSSLIQSIDNVPPSSTSDEDTFRIYVFKNTDSIDFLKFVSSKVDEIKKTISSEIEGLFNKELLAASEEEVECIEIEGMSEQEVLETFGMYRSHFIPISNNLEVDKKVTHMLEEAISSYKKEEI